MSTGGMLKQRRTTRASSIEIGSSMLESSMSIVRPCTIVMAMHACLMLYSVYIQYTACTMLNGCTLDGCTVYMHTYRQLSRVYNTATAL